MRLFVACFLLSAAHVVASVLKAPPTISVPAASFMLGKDGAAFPIIQDEEKSGISYDQQPAHKVELSSFSITKSPVSQQDYSQCSSCEGHNASDVSWAQAAAYAEWLSRQTNTTWRLPTEAEWVYVFTCHREPLDDTIDPSASPEWVSDWQTLYPLARVLTVNPVGPNHGIYETAMTVSKKKEVTRWGLPPTANNKEFGFPAASFRL